MTNGGSSSETIRALIDPCSEATLVSLGLARKLGCQLRHVNIDINGVAGSTMDSARYQTTVYLIVPASRQLIRLEAFVLKTIGIVTPAESLSQNLSRLRKRLLLADPDFHRAAKIEAVLGADVYRDIMRTGVEHHGPWLAQNTVFRWVLTGGAITNRTADSSSRRACTTQTHSATEIGHERLLGLVQRFWELEAIPQIRRVSDNDRECEQIYSEEHQRRPDGRYIVPLPLKQEKVAMLGESFTRARAALSSMHERMHCDPELFESYSEFMNEYLRLGHMRLLTEKEITDYRGPVHYIPHHGIWQRSDRGRKLRVVFNASRPTSTGCSLNVALHAGPRLQSHIATVILRWRRHRIAFCADVQMMFRQILVNEKDVHLQRILWGS